MHHKRIIGLLEKELAGLDAEREAFLAQIDVRRNKLETLIEGHREMIDLFSGAGSFLVKKPEKEPEVINVLVNEPPLGKHEFKGLTIIDATVKYLRMARKGKTPREIGEALIQGGRKANQTKYYFDSIRTALNRRGDKNGIVKIGEEWWLKEHRTPAPRKVSMEELTGLFDEATSQDKPAT